MREIGPYFTLKLRPLRTGLLVVKEFEESSTKLEFDEWDDMATDGGQPEGKGRDQPPPEEVDEVGKGQEEVEDGDSKSRPRKTTKPPTVDKYR